MKCDGSWGSPCCALASDLQEITGCPSGTYQQLCTFNTNMYCCDTCLTNLGVCVTSPGYQVSTTPLISPFIGYGLLLGAAIFIVAECVWSCRQKEKAEKAAAEFKLNLEQELKVDDK